MVAAFRAERAGRRGALRKALQDGRLALRAERRERLHPTPPDAMPAPEEPAAPLTVPAPAAAGSVFARLVAAHVMPDGAPDGAQDAVATEPEHPAPGGARAPDPAVVFAGSPHDPCAAGGTTSPMPGLVPDPRQAVFAETRLPHDLDTGPLSVLPRNDEAARGEAAGADIANATANPATIADPESGCGAAPSVCETACAPVTALGFGPAMEIRFRQLGIATVADLASAEAAGLRAALGDLGDLLNVAGWIAEARACSARAA